MGCVIGTTSKKVIDFNDKYIKYDENSLRSLPSTTNLLSVLSQPSLLINFKTYIQDKWIPSLDKHDIINRNYRLQAKVYALNSIDFYLDVQDFITIHNSQFKTFRACHIFEKYLIHGATRSVQVSSNVIDECSDSIFNNNGLNISNNLFLHAEQECIDFLVSEVFPYFESESKVSVKGSEIFEAVKDTIRRIRRASLSSLEHVKLREILIKILADQEYLTALKAYIGKDCADTILYAYHEAVEIRENLTHLMEASSDIEVTFSSFLYYINGFYDTYIKLGAPFKLNLANSIRSDFLMKLFLSQSADTEVLKVVEEEMLQLLIRVYLTQFLYSPEYRKVFKVRKNSVMTMVKNYQDSIELNVIEKSVNETVESHTMKEMVMYMRSSRDDSFSNYLESRGKLPLLFFSQSILRFQELTYSNDMDLVIDIANIFDRFISRNGADFVAFPEDIKLKIVKTKLLGHDVRIFSEALDWVLDILYIYWTELQNDITRMNELDEKKDELEQVPVNEGQYSKTPIISFSGNGRRSTNWDRRESFKLGVSRENLATNPKFASFRKIGTKPTLCLKDVLEHSSCCSIFKDFLERESSSQTLLFLLEVDEFRRIPDAQFQIGRARKIYNRYINPLAIMPVPITSSVRQEILADLNNNKDLPTIFKKSLVQVHDYIQKVQFPKFQQSSETDFVFTILSQEARSVTKNVARRRSSIGMQSLGENQLTQLTNLKTILQYQSSTRFFKDFSMRTYSYESLFFWLDAENYINLPGSDFMKRMAYKLCKKYILDDARMQINISSSVKQDILAGMSKPNKLLFKNAQDEIFKLLEFDTYPKFLQSAEYELLRTSLINQNSEKSSFRFNFMRRE